MENLSLHAFLKSGTADLHRDVEGASLLSKIFTDHFSAQDYKEILERFYQVYSYLEAQLQKQPELQVSLRDLSLRWKTNSLKKDLKTDSPKALQADLLIQNLSQAMGVMYVLEGSTLGGQIIQRKLKQNSNLQDMSFHFYNHYGDQVGEFWKRFLVDLEAFSKRSDAHWDECLAAARKTFLLMNQQFSVQV